MMKNQSPSGVIRAVVTVWVCIALWCVTTGSAVAVGPCCCFCQQGRCQLEVDVKEVDVKGFKIEDKAICIPPLRFPWECGPIKKCGKVRCVKVLSTDKRKEEVCVYDWKAVLCCPSCREKIQRHRCGPSGTDSCIVASSEASRSPVPSPASLAGRRQGEPDQAEATEVPALAYPVVVVSDVSDEWVAAISQADPEADGWVRVTALPERLRPSDDSLAAESALIEVAR